MADYSAVTNTAFSSAASAVEGLKSHLGPGCIAAHFPQELSAIPGLETLFQEVDGKVQTLLNATTQLYGAIDTGAITAGVSAGSLSKSPISLAGVKSATASLKKAADLSGILDKLDTLLRSDNFVKLAKSKVGTSLTGSQLKAIGKSISTIDLGSLGLVSQIEGARKSLEAVNAKVHSDTYEVLKQLESELDDITSSLKSQAARLFKSVDSALTSLA